ncbi:MAG: hypothetical protein JNL98_21280 [Bryobacterales bacterium]|nr:hypothetical protein [Bryobacterales bacterium]
MLGTIRGVAIELDCRLVKECPFLQALIDPRVAMRQKELAYLIPELCAPLALSGEPPAERSDCLDSLAGRTFRR